MIMLLFLICFTTLILLIWFRTDAWIEYCKIFNVNYICKYKEYEEQKKEDLSLSYHKFLLRNYYHLFFIRLITCPICFSVWVSFILSLIFWLPLYFPIISIFGLLLYGLLNKFI
jgi:hypothetical protein